MLVPKWRVARECHRDVPPYFTPNSSLVRGTFVPIKQPLNGQPSPSHLLPVARNRYRELQIGAWARANYEARTDLEANNLRTSPRSVARLNDVGVAVTRATATPTPNGS